MGRSGLAGKRGRMAAARGAKGFSLWGLMLTIVIVGGIVIPAVRAIPSAIEFFSVKRAASYAREKASSKREVIEVFNKQALIDNFSVLSGDDLDIRQDDAGGIKSVGFSYDRKVPMFGPLTLLITYSGTQY
jgi:hypothetical protein